MNKPRMKRFNAAEVKQAASGRWLEILPAATSIEQEQLNGKNGPCPNCGGHDRFSAMKDAAETGGLLCRHCHNGETKPKAGDGLSAIQWLNGCTFPEALRLVADAVGLLPIDPEDDTRDILGELCKQKRMPIESAKVYGAAVGIRGRQRVVRFPVFDADGSQHSYSDVSPYAAKALNKGMLKPGKGTAGVFLPGRKPEPGETWLIVEGPKDAAALHGLGYLAAGMTGSRLSRRTEKLFTGCDVVLVPDLDRPAMRSTVDNGAALESVASSVRVARLPGDVKAKGGDDIRDVIKRDGIEAVKRSIADAGLFDADSLVDRPAVFIDVENAEIEVTDKVIRILAARGFETEDEQNRTYQRGGKLVHVAEPDPDSGPQIVALTKAGIRERITAAMDLMTTGDEDKPDKPKRTPGWLIDAIYDRPGYFNIRRLDGIVTAPTLRADGSILQRPGYDDQSRLLYLPGCQYPTVPQSPTKGEAEAAAAELLDVVRDFPFADDAARAVWLSMVLALVGRSAIVGNVPLFGITANVRGSGKSKLADLAGIVAYGRAMARKTMPWKDEETRKVITTTAISNKPSLLFDNVTAAVGCDSLDAVLTGPTWEDRILGKSESTGELKWRTVLVATGNNMAFAGDFARRVVLCSLNCADENPEDRTGFVHSDVEQFAKDDRARLVVASLTLLRAFFATGKPYDGKRLGSFETWSETICGAVVFAGMPNPLETVSIVREQDNSGAVFRGLLNGLAEVASKDGLTSREILEGIDGDSSGFETLRDVLGVIADKLTTRRIGNQFSKYCGRVADGRRIVKVAGRAGVVRWSVEQVASAAEVETETDPENTVGKCKKCGHPLTARPTGEGWFNRDCDSCGFTDSPVKAA